MINVIARNSNNSLVDRSFTFGVNLIQSTLVKRRVAKVTDIHMDRRGPKASEGFANKLSELGLFGDRLWWGPMTLFPRKAEFLIDEIDRVHPTRILEIGSGTSTAIFAALGHRYGFEVLSLENHMDTISYVQWLLEGTPCEDKLTIQHCGFSRYQYPNGERFRWYDVDLRKSQCKYDFVFIDGPMGRLVGRNGALPMIVDCLLEPHRIILDDINRRHERDCVNEWRRHYPQLKVETFENCQGLALITL